MLSLVMFVKHVLPLVLFAKVKLNVSNVMNPIISVKMEHVSSVLWMLIVSLAIRQKNNVLNVKLVIGQKVKLAFSYPYNVVTGSTIQPKNVMMAISKLEMVAQLHAQLKINIIVS